MAVVLVSRRLRLRTFTADDLDALIALDSDPGVMAHLTGGQPVPAAEVRERVLPAFLDWHARGPDYGYFVAEELATGAFLGWFHWRPATRVEPGTIEVGYRLRRAAWGQGYATEGARALLARGFHQQGLPRVIAMTLADHHASRRVLEKAGLRHERDFHFDGPPNAWHTGRAGVLYALDRADYRPSLTPTAPPEADQ